MRAHPTRAGFQGVLTRRIHFPCMAGVGEIGAQAFFYDAAFGAGVEYWEADFYAAEKVALHPVGARQVHDFFTVREEIKDPMMFEEAADDGAHFDVFRHAGHAGAQGADAAYDEVDFHASGAGS